MNFQASKLSLRIEMAGLSPYFQALWLLLKFVGKICFSLALLWALLWFFYFRHFRGRYFEAPRSSLNYVTDTDAPQRNDFRKRTVSSITDPIRMQLAKIETLRKQSKSGTVKPPTLEKSATKIRSRLKQIMTEARLRRIPVEFKYHYEPALYAIQDAYRSINALEDCFEQEALAERHKLYNESVQSWRGAMRKNSLTREFFLGDDWQKVGISVP